MTSDLKVVPLSNQNVRIGFIACGKHHTVAIEAPSPDHSPRVFSWGCGNYGCLGHGPQKDEYRPRLISTLSTGPIWDSNPAVSAAAGASCSLILTKRGHVYYCGRHRSVGEAVMRPSLLEALANNGHVVEHVSAGSGSVVCSTKNAVTVSWGQGPHGELGYGEKKSSAKPAFVTSLDKCRVRGIACGQGTTLFLVAEEDEEDKAAIKQLNVLDPEDVEELEIE
jgi:alpha-tubulin suppressor-like RCC1 family protein